MVPDSDDEDALDSQSTISNEPHNDEQDNAIRNAETGVQTHEDEEKGEGNIQQSELQNDTASPASSDEDLGSTLPIPAHISELEMSSRPLVGGNELTPTSSPVSQRVFKVPEIFWELEREEDGTVSVPPRGAEDDITPGDEEVSRSYVQITSPTSSILSSLPASQFSLPPNPPTDRPQALQSTCSVEENVPTTMTTYTGRSLRQRNPIQLHPYIVEQEKYRQTFKARGLAPMRIAPSQDELHRRSPQSASPELDSQEKDSQHTTETGDSQPMDFDWDPLPSSSPQKVSDHDVVTDTENNQSHLRNEEEEVEDDEDEDFPNIDQLLSARLPLAHPVQPRRRIKSYSTKSKHQILSKAQTARKEQPAREFTPKIAFRVPGSPPATSSPLPTMSTESAPLESRTKSTAMDDPIQNLPDHNALDMQKSADLPTPATSSRKPAPIFVDSDTENQLTSEQADSSSDESIQIRRVSKKIRGVLPASHLRLDHQQWKPQIQNRIRRDSFSISPVRTEARRGVALPRVHGALQSPTALSGSRLHFLSSDSEEQEEENGEAGFILRIILRHR